MIEDSPARHKFRLWSAWVFANAIGLGLGWPLGETVGRQIAGLAGWRTGQIIGALLCESLLWLARGIVLSRLGRRRLVRSLDLLIWAAAEGVGWIAGTPPIDEGSLLAITGGAVLALTTGSMVWLALWFVRLPRPKTRLWGLRSALWVLFAFVAGSALLGLATATSIELGYALSRLGVAVAGMAAAGLATGASVGSLTGLAMASILDWPERDL